MALVLLILARHQHSWTYVYAAAALVLAGVLVEPFARGLHWGWMKLAEGLGFISSRILLTVVYVLVVLPVAFFAKRSGKLSIKLGKGGRGASGFKDRNHVFVKEDLENPW